MTDDEYWKQGIEKLASSHKQVMTLVGLFPEPRKEQVRKMLAGPVGEQYFAAPASTRRAHHNAFPGGLVLHSLNVLENLVKIATALCPRRFPDHQLAFCALFHDLGKAGPRGLPTYLPTTDEWKKKRGEYYEVDQKNWLPTSEKGLFILQQEGVELDLDEYLAIRLNDGAGPTENKPYAFHTPTLALLTHWADHYAAEDEKRLGLRTEP